MNESKVRAIETELLDAIIEGLLAHRENELATCEALPTDEPFRRGLRLGMDYSDLHTLEWLRSLRDD